MRCWWVTSSVPLPNRGTSSLGQGEVHLELAFENLISNDQLQWVTITSPQAIMMSICLQSMVDELMVKQSGDSIRKMLHRLVGGTLRCSDSQQAVKSPPLLESPDATRESMVKLSNKLSAVSLQVAVQELGKEAELLGEAAEAPGFQLKPAEAQPVGMSLEEEFWNIQQGLQEPLSRNTHKEPEPVCERVVPTYQILALPEETNTKDWTVAPEFILPESQALEFGYSVVEYGELVSEDLELALDSPLFVLPKPKVISYLEQGKDPYIQGSPVFKDNPEELLSDWLSKVSLPLCLIFKTSRSFPKLE
ncbi:hypothetical protein JEQ12_012279 [Ovis aries]|uniref:Sorting nexin-17/31 FERM domain-containing protein n=1 Tax=Ovis aries TaxID=9940 RepID=A0A835ZSE0_SHEEP|nr:hypothetical protein JEQ12_012279 [Ovis aries]